MLCLWGCPKIIYAIKNDFFPPSTWSGTPNVLSSMQKQKIVIAIDMPHGNGRSSINMNATNLVHISKDGQLKWPYFNM